MIQTDVVIVGAGPCGLFQVFELGLLGLKAEVVDSIRQPGGQCTELYPDKPIYDIPAIPVCTGQELVDDLLRQIEPFHCGMHLGQEVTVVRRQEDDSFFVETSAGTQFTAKAVVIAGGVGSFQPRPLRVPGIEAFEDVSVHYRVRDPKQFAGKKVVILGGGVADAIDRVFASYAGERDDDRRLGGERQVPAGQVGHAAGHRRARPPRGRRPKRSRGCSSRRSWASRRRRRGRRPVRRARPPGGYRGGCSG